MNPIKANHRYLIHILSNFVSVWSIGGGKY